MSAVLTCNLKWIIPFLIHLVRHVHLRAFVEHVEDLKAIEPGQKVHCVPSLVVDLVEHGILILGDQLNYHLMPVDNRQSKWEQPVLRYLLRDF